MMNVMNLLSENEMLNTFAGGWVTYNIDGVKYQYMLQNNQKFSMLNISTKKKC